MTMLALAHGWGYDSSMWSAVAARLPQKVRIVTLDFGYFGPVRGLPDAAEPLLAVGHSLGALWWLVQQDIPWRRLLMINGFPRFTAAAGYPGVASRVLARMRARFAAQAPQVLAEFHARCGYPGPTAPPVTDRLAAGLARLAEWDGRPQLAARADDVWAVSADGDPIVPRSLAAAAFAVLPAGRHRFIAAEGHLLPLSHPEIIASLIMEIAC